MVNFSASVDDYIEEENFGEHLDSGIFDSELKKFYLVSGKHVLLYDVATGQRLHVLKHSNGVIGLQLYDDLLLSLTDAPELYFWDSGSQQVKRRRALRILDGYKPLWTYTANENFYLFIVKLKIDGENSGKDSALLKMENGELFNDDQQPLCPKLVIYTGKRPATKKCLYIASDFYVKCEGKRVKMVKFADKDNNDEEEVVPDSDTETKLRPINNNRMHNEFVLKSHFNVVDQSLVEFDAVFIAGNILYAILNVGRIYAWSRFDKCGIARSNSSNITLTGHRVIVTATAQGTMFIGTGDGFLCKYNFSGTSGVGRWHKLEQMHTECSSRALMLSPDSNTLISILVDNSACVIRTSGLTLIAKAENTKRSPTNWIGIQPDPTFSKPKHLLANSRIGHLQWIDPDNWKTIDEADIAQETSPPHEDTFNLPDFIWMDTYLCCLTRHRIVTCECRRDNPEKTYLKIWKRRSKTNMKLELEECFVLTQRIAFVRSTVDDSDLQELIVINKTEEMDLYMQDSNRKGHWRKDMKRHRQNCAVKHCSLVKNLRFATVNSLGNSSVVLIWLTSTLTVLQIIGTVKDAQEVEWSPQPFVLLIACRKGIIAYNCDGATFIWAIKQSGLSIFSSQFITFAHNAENVFILNSETGILEKDPLKFGRPQAKIVAISVGEDAIGFCGMTAEGSISILKPKLAAAQITKTGQKKQPKNTPFSQMFDKNGDEMRRKRRKQTEDEEEEGKDGKRARNSIVLMELPSVSRFVDGPAHSLGPISELTRNFVHACLVKRKKPQAPSSL